MPQNFDQTERNRILAVLRRNRFVRTRAAKELGISRVTLWQKMKRYGITDPGAIMDGRMQKRNPNNHRRQQTQEEYLRWL